MSISRETLLNIINTVDRDRFFKPVSELDDIVIKNAIKTYAPKCRPDDIVAIYDTTLSGSGRKGYLLTCDKIYNENFKLCTLPGGGVTSIPLDGISDIECVDEGNNFYEVKYENGDVQSIWISDLHRDDILYVLQGIAGLPQALDAQMYQQEEKGPSLQELCERVADNDPEAAMTLAKMYAEGDDVPQDDKEAEKWHKIAAGITMELELELAKKHYPEDMTAVVNHLEQASSLGSAEAAYTLAQLYENGLDESDDGKEAFQCYLTAAKRGYVAAMVKVAELYEKGTGTEADKEKALKWYCKAADCGDAAAADHAVRTYDLSEEMYFAYCRIAADQGYAAEMYLLGALYRYGKGTKENFEKAIYWYEKAADAGVKAAHDDLFKWQRERYLHGIK